MDPGLFFQPLSALILLGFVGALACGWGATCRKWILVSLAAFIVIWILTPTVFWPMIYQMWEVHRGRMILSEFEIAALVHRWILWDSLRIALIAIVFFGTLKALASPIAALGKKA